MRRRTTTRTIWCTTRLSRTLPTTTCQRSRIFDAHFPISTLIGLSWRVLDDSGGPGGIASLRARSRFHQAGVTIRIRDHDAGGIPAVLCDDARGNHPVMIRAGAAFDGVNVGGEIDLPVPDIVGAGVDGYGAAVPRGEIFQ